MGKEVQLRFLGGFKGEGLQKRGVLVWTLVGGREWGFGWRGREWGFGGWWRGWMEMGLTGIYDGNGDGLVGKRTCSRVLCI